MTTNYILVDWFDGRTIRLLNRISCRRLAREYARKFARSYDDDFDLIEIRDNGERQHIHRYRGQYGGRPLFTKI